MPFKEMPWEHSDDPYVPEDIVKVTPGVKDLYIDNASMDLDGKYSISVHNVLEPKEKMTFNYWINTNDENNNIVPNATARGTLHTLGFALAGRDIGMPAPGSIIGAVVRVDVKMSKPNVNGAQFPRAYKFEKSPDETIIDHSSTDQYLDMDDE